MSKGLRAEIPASAPCPRLEQDPAILESFASDAAHVPDGFAAGVMFPTSAAEMAAATAAASRVLPVGAQSSLTGGATPRGEIILSTRQLTALDRLDEHRVRVGAGVPLARLQEWLSAQGSYYPPVPTFDGAFVGGTIATNAAGAATFKYGPTRAWVLGVTVVLANGRILHVARGDAAAAPDGTLTIDLPGARAVSLRIPTYRMPDVPKLSAGYYARPGMDAIDLFIGSEGTLGIITDAILRVVPHPRRASALISCRDDDEAMAVTGALREQARLTWAGRAALDVAAIEYMDAASLAVVPDAEFRAAGIGRPLPGTVLLLAQIEVGSDNDETFAELADALEQCGIESDPVLAPPGDERASARLFRLREAVPASVNALVARAKTSDPGVEKTAGDFIVPFDRLRESLSIYRETLDARGLPHAIWGHVSDGNLHVNVLPRSFADVTTGREALVELARWVIDAGGSPLAEHGVGRSTMKQRLLRELYGEDGIEQMREVKRALDPAWKLAPGVLFPPRAEQ